MFKIVQRHGRESGLMLWRIDDPLGRTVGYAADLGTVLTALHRDQEPHVLVETFGAKIKIEILAAEDAEAEGAQSAPAPVAT